MGAPWFALEKVTRARLSRANFAPKPAALGKDKDEWHRFNDVAVLAYFRGLAVPLRKDRSDGRGCGSARIMKGRPFSLQYFAGTRPRL